mmetsp:Transcript_391/g.368  ORF Transcript_391/g.368 Transcript_391/m.368 type:complete len:221 (-) Transcript_391:528-1190(-)
MMRLCRFFDFVTLNDTASPSLSTLSTSGTVFESSSQPFFVSFISAMLLPLLVPLLQSISSSLPKSSSPLLSSLSFLMRVLRCIAFFVINGLVDKISSLSLSNCCIDFVAASFLLFLAAFFLSLLLVLSVMLVLSSLLSFFSSSPLLSLLPSMISFFRFFDFGVCSGFSADIGSSSVSIFSSRCMESASPLCVLIGALCFSLFLVLLLLIIVQLLLSFSSS